MRVNEKNFQTELLQFHDNRHQIDVLIAICVKNLAQSFLEKS